MIKILRCVISNHELAVKSWKELSAHYLTMHKIIKRDKAFVHYLYALTKPPLQKIMNCLICNLPFVNNRMYYGHMLEKHHEKRLQHGGNSATDGELIREVVDQVRSLKVIKLTLQCPEDQARDPIQFIDESILKFSTYLEEAFNNTQGSVTLQLESSYINKKVQMGEIIEESLPRKKITNTITIAKVNIRGALRKLNSSIKASLYLAIGANGSNWQVHRFIDIKCRCSEDALINSGMVNEIMGGSKHDVEFDADPLLNHILKGYFE